MAGSLCSSSLVLMTWFETRSAVLFTLFLLRIIRQMSSIIKQLIFLMAYAFSKNYMYTFINAAENGNWRVMLVRVVVVHKVNLSSAACADLPVYNSEEGQYVYCPARSVVHHCAQCQCFWFLSRNWDIFPLLVNRLKW